MSFHRFSLGRPAPVLLALGVLVALAPAAARAQGMATAPPPVRSSVDGNGVDLVSGTLIIATPQVSIGQGEGALAYTRLRTSTGWVDNTIGTIANPAGMTGCATSGTVTVSFGGGSEAFTAGTSTYINAQGGGATLTCAAPNYTYTTADGTVVVFNQNLPAYSPAYATGGRAVSATSPDGLTVTYAYTTAPTGLTPASRLQSVNNNFGYQLKFTYANNNPLSNADLPAWTTIAGVAAINNAVEYCSPTAASCTLTGSWPTVTYAPGTGSSVVVTDPMSNMSIFSYNAGGQLTGIQRPGASGNTTAITYSPIGLVQTVTNSARVVGPKGSGAGFWSYAYSTLGSTQTTTVTDPLGHTRSVASSTTTGLVASDTDGLNRTTSYLYDSYGRLTQVTRPETDYTVLAYDARGNLTTATRYPNNGPGHGSIVTNAVFDPTCGQPSKCNKPNSTTDANGHVTSYMYTAAGQLKGVAGPPPSPGAVAPNTQLTYTSLNAWYIQSQGGGVAAAPTAVSLLTGTTACQTLASCGGTADQVVSTLSYGTSGVADNLGLTSAKTASGAGTHMWTAPACKAWRGGKRDRCVHMSGLYAASRWPRWFPRREFQTG